MYEKEYKQAMDDLNFSPDFQERTVRAMEGRRPRKRRGLFCTAVAAAVAVSITLGLLLWPAEGPNGPVSALSAYALSEPVYPDFPQFPKSGDGQALDGSGEEYRTYLSEVDALRLGTRDVHAPALLTAFAAKSAPLVLEGHEGENAVYSPVSLWMALAMLARCAGGESREQVLSALGAEDMDELSSRAERLWRRLYTDDGASSLIVANSIWLDRELRGTFNNDTLAALSENFYAGSYTVPMGTPEAGEAVGKWVSEQTNGLIEAGVDTEDVLALLVSSLYYKARWNTTFSPSQTEPDTFTCAGGQENTVDFMHRTVEMGRFLRRSGYLAAALYTALGEVVFVLPDEGTAPEELLAREGFLAGLNLDAGELGEVEWSVPKFDVQSKLDLAPALGALGITDLPDPERADLSGLTSAAAYLAGAEQLGRVKMDEEGAEAAAVTMLYMSPSSEFMITETAVMDLDRPFLFVIRQEGIPLFIGVVNRVG